MQTKSTKIDFNGQNIFVGIDVHLTSWKITIMAEEIVHKTYSQDANAEQLAGYLKSNFPGAKYYSAYEAGFCGFSVHRELVQLGINNIVVNAADIPTTDKEKKQKEDKRDSRKIAKALKNKELEAIYVPSKEMEEMRGLIRYRKSIVKEIARHKNRVKSYLYFNGVKIPESLRSASQYWSGHFTQWLETIESTTPYGQIVLRETLDTIKHLRKKLLKINKELRGISKESLYSNELRLLQSVPGIGLIVAITILSELENIMRFNNIDKLCSFIGLVPTTNSSGEKEKTGRITNRSNNALRSSLIESAWVAARIDPTLIYCFNDLCKRMKHNEAIVRIAKKLLSRIRYVMKNKKEYVYSIV